MQTEKLEQIFALEKQIIDVMKPNYEFVDGGMFIGESDNEYYERQMTLESVSNNNEYYSFSYNLLGDVKGEIPQDKKDSLYRLLHKLT